LEDLDGLLEVLQLAHILLERRIDADAFVEPPARQREELSKDLPELKILQVDEAIVISILDNQDK
jgi:hypothetical protein